MRRIARVAAALSVIVAAAPATADARFKRCESDTVIRCGTVQVPLDRSGRVPDPVYDRVMPMAELDRVLPETDILVMSLPSTPETVGVLSRERLALLPESAILVNVGRGSAIDQDALMDALNAGRLAGAALDVMTPEPLLTPSYS